MTMEPAEGRRPDGSKEAAKTDAERGAAALGRRSESLGEELRSFEKDAGEAEKMLERVKDPAKREEFRSALSSLRGRAGGAGNALRAAVAGLALFAGGVGIGKGMNDERREASMIEMARKTGEAEAENRMLKAQLAKKDDAPVAAPADRSGIAAAEKATDALARENKALLAQLDAMAKDVAKLRQERDEANARVLEEKEKGIVTRDSLLKQQTVSANLSAIYEKMKDMIDQSGDPKLKAEADRYLAMFE